MSLSPQNSANHMQLSLCSWLANRQPKLCCLLTAWRTNEKYLSVSLGKKKAIWNKNGHLKKKSMLKFISQLLVHVFCSVYQYDYLFQNVQSSKVILSSLWYCHKQAHKRSICVQSEGPDSLLLSHFDSTLHTVRAGVFEIVLFTSFIYC